MAIPHAQSGQVIDVRPLGPSLADERTVALFKTDVISPATLCGGSDFPAVRTSRITPRSVLSPLKTHRFW